MNNDGREYVIPLTSGKDKHKNWADVNASWYRIYEVIDITESPVKPDDVIVKIKNQDILRKIDKDKQKDYRQRILSVLDLRKIIVFWMKREEKYLSHYQKSVFRGDITPSKLISLRNELKKL